MTNSATYSFAVTDGAGRQYDRPKWMTLLAEARSDELETYWARISHPKFTWIRRPEQGSAMIRGRASGTGAQFNLGDVTVMRCTLQLETGEVGVAYVMGRDKRHAALAAVFDAMLLREAASGEKMTAQFISSLAASRDRRHQSIAVDTQSSKVDFTMLSREQA